MRNRPRVMFLCTGNACRSQMAEGWLRHLAGDRFESLSAGTAPAGIDPRAIAAMTECEVDISGQSSKSVDAFLADPPELVITVCDRAAKSCPSFPGTVEVLRWSFADPAAASGSEEEVRATFREIRDSIRARIAAWVATH